MITLVSSERQIERAGDIRTIDLRGLSTDEKPTEKYGDTIIGNGSTYLEIDTGLTLYYDEESKDWLGGEDEE